MVAVRDMARTGFGVPACDPNVLGVYDSLGPAVTLVPDADMQPVAVWQLSRPFSRFRLDLRRLEVLTAGSSLELLLGGLTSCEDGSSITILTASKAFGKVGPVDEAVGVGAGILADFIVLWARVNVAPITYTFTPRLTFDRVGSQYVRLAGGWA